MGGGFWHEGILELYSDSFYGWAGLWEAVTGFCMP